MDLYVLIPLIIGTGLSVSLFRSAEKEKGDYVAKIWLYIISIVFAVLTIFFTGKSIEFNKKTPTIQEVKGDYPEYLY